MTMSTIVQIYILLFALTVLQTYCQTLDICSSGDCSWNNPSTDTIRVCTNTATSCTISMGSVTSGANFNGGKVYSAAPTTTVDCNGDNGCRYGEFHCGNELPPNAEAYGLTEANFSGTINNCYFDCNHIFAQVCSDTKIYCSGDIVSCYAKSSLGISLDRSVMNCQGIINPNGACTMECNGGVSCMNAVMDCTNTMATCSTNARASIQTSKPTTNPTTSIPTIAPTTAQPTAVTLYPSATPSIYPTLSPTNRPSLSGTDTLLPTMQPIEGEYSGEYEVSFDVDNDLDDDEINDMVLVAIQSSYPNAEIIDTKIDDKSVVVTLSIISDTELDAEIVQETIKNELEERNDIDNVVAKEVENKPREKENNSNSVGIVLGVIGGFMAVLIIIFAVCIWCRYRQSDNDNEGKQIEMPMKMAVENAKHQTVDSTEIQNEEEDEDEDDDIVQSVNSFGITEGNTFSNDTNILRGEFVVDDDKKNRYDTRGGIGTDGTDGTGTSDDNVDNDLDVDVIIDRTDNDTPTPMEEEDDNDLETETIVGDNSEENNDTTSDDIDVDIDDINTLQ